MKKLLPFVAFSILLLAPVGVQNSYAGFDQEILQLGDPISVSCTSSGQLCEPLSSTIVQTDSVLQVKFTAASSHCSSIRVHVFLDGTQVATSQFLGWPGAPPPFDTLPLMTNVIDLGPVSPGTYEIGLQGEGQVSGCNTGQLGGWGGTLTVTRSIEAACGDMFVVTGFEENSVLDDGAFALVDYPGSGKVVQIGDEIASQVDKRSLSGMAFSSAGELFVVATGGGQEFGSILLKIDPTNGQILTNIGEVKDGEQSLKVRDLAMFNGVLYGVADVGPSSLIIIDTSDASATVEPTDQTFLNGLAITPDGTFYTTNFSQLYTIDPSNGDTTFVVLLDTAMDGLGADDSGNLFGTQSGPESVHLIDISDGSDVTVGAEEDNPSDVDFLPCPVVPPSIVGGEFLPIETTSLILAGAQSFSWMIPVVLSVLGIGLFVFRKSENS